MSEKILALAICPAADPECGPCERKAKAAYARLSASGYVIVPREPTDEMIAAGEDRMLAADVWSAMLAAAQEQPK